jgi:putative membrane protein
MGGIMMLLFWGLVLICLALLIRWLVAAGDSRRQLSAPLTESPMEILKKRYARGEITKEQYESMRRDLE